MALAFFLNLGKFVDSLGSSPFFKKKKVKTKVMQLFHVQVQRKIHLLHVKKDSLLD